MKVRFEWIQQNSDLIARVGSHIYEIRHNFEDKNKYDLIHILLKPTGSEAEVLKEGSTSIEVLQKEARIHCNG